MLGNCSGMTYLRKSETQGHIEGTGRTKRADLVTDRLVSS